MVGFVGLHHLAGHLFRFIPVIELLDCESAMVAGVAIKAEDLKLGAMLIRVNEDNGRHGRFPFLTVADSIICTAPTGAGFAFAGQIDEKLAFTPSTAEST